MKQDINQLFREYETCQQVKYEITLSARLLQPLPLPQQAWTDLSMDIIKGLPKSTGFDVIMVVVDCFTKFGHFIAWSHPYTTSTVVELFMNNIFKLHGLPKSIVSNKDLIFVSSFWKTLFTLQGSTLQCSSTTYHL